MDKIPLYESFTKHWIAGKLQNALRAKHAKTMKPILQEMIPYGLQLEVDYQTLAKELYYSKQNELKLKIKLSSLESEIQDYQNEIEKLDEYILELEK